MSEKMSEQTEQKDEKTFEESVIEKMKDKFPDEETRDTGDKTVGDKTEQTETTETITFKTEDDLLEFLKKPEGKVKEYIEALIENSIKAVISGRSPKRSDKQPDSLTKEKFKQMNYYERLKLYNENRALYEALKQ